MAETLKVTKLSEFATIPSRGSSGAAGFDLYSAYDCVIPAHGHMLCKTDIAMEIEAGHYGRVAPRSGLAVRNKIHVGAGVIDQDYRSGIGVLLFNFSKNDFNVKRGDRIAQIIIQKIAHPIIVVTEPKSSQSGSQ